MKSSGRLLTSLTLFLAITGAAVMLAGCANPGGEMVDAALAARYQA